MVLKKEKNRGELWQQHVMDGGWEKETEEGSKERSIKNKKNLTALEQDNQSWTKEGRGDEEKFRDRHVSNPNGRTWNLIVEGRTEVEVTGNFGRGSGGTVHRQNVGCDELSLGHPGFETSENTGCLLEMQVWHG